MTVTLVKQLSLQPKDTFETLRHRFTKSETIDFDATSELVYFARRDDVTLCGATSFIATSYHEPFKRQVDANVSHSRYYTYVDYSARGSDISLGIWGDIRDDKVMMNSPVFPFDSERDSQMDPALREHLNQQRAVNRHFEPVVRAAERKIIAQWLNGHSESRHPQIHRAALHLPVIDYLDALGVMNDMQVMSSRQARRTVNDHTFGSWAPIARPTIGTIDHSIERTASMDLQAGDVVQAFIGDFCIESIEHLTGVGDRQCVVLAGHYLMDGEPEILVRAEDPYDPGNGYRVLKRAA